MSQANIYFLNDASFSSDRKMLVPELKNKVVLIMAQASWCGHCQRAKPEFQKAVDKWCQKPGVAFATIDGSQDSTESEKALLARLDVEGFPTFFTWDLYGLNQVSPGDRSVDGFRAILDAAGAAGLD